MQGLTQAQLAQRVGLERTSITNIELGKQTISEPVLNAMAQALGYRVKIRFEKL
ncbi:helix-turn-helix protein [compost metagenome]